MVIEIGRAWHHVSISRVWRGELSTYNAVASAFVEGGLEDLTPS